MKKIKFTQIYAILFIVLSTINAFGADSWFPEGIQVKTGSTIGAKQSANSKAMLDVISTTKGVLLPRMTTAQRTAITSVPEGLLVYDTDLHAQFKYDGTAWRRLATLAGTETLTNKTLSGNTATNLISGSGTFTLNTSGTVTAPNATDTLVGKATTDTLTNKTLSGNTATNLISGSGTFTLNTTGTITAPNATDTLVGKATTDTLTNKTINGSNNTITNVSLSSGVTGSLPIANGGTGQGTKAAGFDALSPMTTSGDIIYGGASGTGTRLAKGSDGQVLTLASGIPSWVASSGGRTPVPSYTTKYASGTSHTRSIAFVVSGVTTAAAAATYTNNGSTFTVRQAYASGANYIIFSGTGTPTSSGTLTKSAGTGDSTITFSEALTPISIDYVVQAAGGGGGGSGTATPGAGATGGNSTLTVALGTVTANGGGGGAWAHQTGGARGSYGLSTVTNAYGVEGGGGGGSTGTGSELYWPGGTGGEAGCGGGGGNSAANAGTNGGGGAGGTVAGTGGPGSGGGGGGCVRGTAPAAGVTSWTFAVGAGGTAGSAGGGSGTVGGTGGDGYLALTENF